MKIHNFSAGPSILPREVFEEAAKGVLHLEGSGLSILEISHRSPTFTDIINKAKSLVREILNLPENYHVLFLSGGASTQFLMAPINCLPEDGKACYIDTGSWASKAIKEAQSFGQVEILASSKSANYTFIPKEFTVPADASYLHITSNNTIYGTQYQRFPECDIPIICDMSSDIFSKPIPVDRFGIIYAGAQKNMGPAGTTLVIVRDDMLGKAGRSMPTMLNYQTHVDKDSMFNTPPVFPIYVSMLTLQWLKDQGGIPFVQERNQKKAQLLYEEIDRNSLFEGVVDREDRSTMNVTFVMKDPSLELTFLTACKSAGCDGVKGHRSVGGFRASIYNAMGLEGIKALISVMQDFENKYSLGNGH